MGERINRFAKRLRALWKRGQFDRDLEDELRSHLEMNAADTGDAWGARRRFGNVTAIQEACREMRTFTAVESCWQDIRYALRTLAKNPAITLVAVAALALGMGANTAVFTIISKALSFDLGVEQVERIVLVSLTSEARRDVSFQSYLNFRELRSQIKSLQSLAAYRFAPVNVSDRNALPERLFCVQMSASGLALMGRRPVLGRSFGPADEGFDATPVLMLSYHVWQDRYATDPSIIGRTVRVDAVPRTVIGVMPAGMRFPEDTDLWIPLTVGGLQSRDFLIFGRLADGVKLAAARAEIDTIARRLASKYPDTFKNPVADVRPILAIYGVYDSRPMLIAILCAVGFVLLIACADVANLLLARAAARSREISIRIAIGAGRMRIIRQLLIESVALAILGGVLGWIIAMSLLHWFDLQTAKLPRPPWIDFSMDVKAFGYLAAISIGAGILFGLAPAVRLSKVDVSNAVKDGGQSAAGGVRGRHLASLLVIFEMSLCVVLLAGAGLLIRSSLKLYTTPMGVNIANVLTMHINLPEAKYPRAEDEVAFHERLKRKLQSLPGVEVASLASNLPGAGWMSMALELDAVSQADAGHLPDVGVLAVGSDYFRVMRVAARRGRVFDRSDEDTGAPAVIVNESFVARYYLPGEDPVGKRLRLAKSGAPQPWLTVVGVVPDIQQNFRRPLQQDPLVYVPYAAQPQRIAFIVARTSVPPSSLAEAFRREVQSLDQDLPVYDLRTLEDRIAQNRLNVSAIGMLFTIFAAIALVLASAGLYGVMAHSVSRRTREIGVRMAVGGSGRDIRRLIFGEAIRQIAIGLAVGLPAAFAVTRVLRTSLVGVSPGDPITFATVIVVLMLSGVLGAAIPARRAVRVDPIVALRCE